METGSICFVVDSKGSNKILQPSSCYQFFEQVNNELVNSGWYKLDKYKCFSLSAKRFAVTLRTLEGKTYEEIIIANNKQEAMWQAQDYNPYSKVIEANQVYK